MAKHNYDAIETTGAALLSAIRAHVAKPNSKLLREVSAVVAAAKVRALVRGDSAPRV